MLLIVRFIGVNQSADLYFALIAPACVMLFGALLVACWWLQRHARPSRFLLWLAAGYVLPSIALMVQSLMTNAQLSAVAPFTACFYLGGGWCIAQGMAKRQGAKGVSVALGLLVSASVVAGLYYFSRVSDDLWMRVQILTLGMALLQLLAAKIIWTAELGTDRFEKWVRWTYGASLAWALLRPLGVWLLPVQEVQQVTRSGYWLVTLSLAVLFGLWFALALLACTVRDMLSALREERDRDPLTSLLNRRAFMESAAQLLADRRLSPWVVVAADIDFFKRINDRWGHACGDKVLSELARWLPLQVRENDLVARFGGEEFVLLLSGVQLDAAKVIVERMRTGLRSHQFSALPANEPLTMSFGVAPVPSWEMLETALLQADALLYEAKNAGRDRVQVSQQSSDSAQANSSQV